MDNNRAPTLRDLVNHNGVLNGPLIHDGSLKSLMDVIDHYDNIQANPLNTNLDNRLSRGNNGQNLNLTQDEKDALEAFLLTLTGTTVYTAEQWSDPFDSDGNIDIQISNILLDASGITISPNTPGDIIIIEWVAGSFVVQILDVNEDVIETITFSGTRHVIDIGEFSPGTYYIEIQDQINSSCNAKIKLN